jgi:transcriptional regulator with GAF, ATPase, and Fis domain
MAHQLEMALPVRRTEVRFGERCRGDHSIVGTSDPLTHVMRQVDQVAPTSATVLLLGETGTGKELLARAIHQRSPRRLRNFVVVNCGALPPSLIESELFGRERGAFTGADTAQAGRFEFADGGTVFLDEIGELPPEIQPKLLRVIQEGEVERLGGTRTARVDVRIIAATNRRLAEDVRRGRFRRDLFYRLNVFPITVPPLRERREDIPALVRFLVDRLGNQLRRPIARIAPGSIEALARYHWPGNIRELENAMERAVALERTPAILPDSLPEQLCGAGAAPAVSQVAPIPEGFPEVGFDLERHVQDIEREYIAEALRRAGGVKVKAAELLGMSFRSFRYYTKKYNLK